MRCRWCGAPVKHSDVAKGWVHTLPLALFAVSRRELDDIRHDPPPKGLPMTRQSHIHPAQPE